jgi:hypothetical protein
LETGNKKQGYRMIFITVIVILIAICGFMVAKNENLQQVLKNTVPSNSTPTQDTVRAPFVAPDVSAITNRQIPWVEVTSDTGTNLSQNTPFTFTVKGSSGGKDITGYDVLLAIDPTMFEIVSIDSAIPAFSILKFEKGSHVTITGIKDLGQNEPSIFNDTMILKVTVKPIQKGNSTLSVLLTNKHEKTIFVDTEVNPITPQVGSLAVSVQ